MDAARVRLPSTGNWATVRDYFCYLLPRQGSQAIDAAFADGRYVDPNGQVLTAQTPFTPALTIYFYRDLPSETDDASDLRILYQDERIVVVDKPHLVATMPRGAHVRQTALAQARRLTGCATLTPAHRLDRDTAGVLLMTTQPVYRGAYQELFAARAVVKCYLAVAGSYPGHLPMTIRTHQVKERGVIAAYQVPTALPNAETRMELLDIRGALALYRLTPRTGRTHQLRLHLAGLGIPIIGDVLYPVGAVRLSRYPLQLLAQSLTFTDPIDHQRRHFVSHRSLAAWERPVQHIPQ